jgi:hypothetical protein
MSSTGNFWYEEPGKVGIKIMPTHGDIGQGALK